MSNRYSEKQRARLVSGWLESGESRAVYAKRHGVSVGSLTRWEAELVSKQGEAMRFVEVEVPRRPEVERAAGAVAGLLLAEVVLPGGAMVRFFSREDAC